HLYLKGHKILNNTTVNTVDFYIRYGAKTDFVPKVINGLVKYLHLDFVGYKTIIDITCDHQINDEGG
ncbi:5739_t:CDS:1, partial [Racocetra fulgida]